MDTRIETENLLLLAGDKRMLELAIEGNQPLAEYLNVVVPSSWTEFGLIVFQYSLNKLQASDEEHRWWTYFSIHKADI